MKYVLLAVLATVTFAGFAGLSSCGATTPLFTMGQVGQNESYVCGSSLFGWDGENLSMVFSCVNRTVVVKNSPPILLRKNENASSSDCFFLPTFDNARTGAELCRSSFQPASAREKKVEVILFFPSEKGNGTELLCLVRDAYNPDPKMIKEIWGFCPGSRFLK